MLDLDMKQRAFGAILIASLSGHLGCNDAGTCNGLSTEAQKQLEAVVQQNSACEADDDCVMTSVGRSGACAAPCGVLTSKSGAAAVVSAASDACQDFSDLGCAEPIVECPASPPSICSSATCTTFTISLAPSSLASLEHGVCQAFQLDYSDGVGPKAPRDLAMSIQFTDGTLFADPACTNAVATSQSSSNATGTISIPAGAHDVAFGFVPANPGNAFVGVLGQVGGGIVSFDVR
jgi:hypothetical protein